MLVNAAAIGLTIIVLTHDRRELLRGCLESLFAQDDPGIPMHFIVVDDGSSDGTAEMVRALTASRPQWRCVSQAQRGIAAARNTGIRNNRTALTAIVADDYLLPPDYAHTIADFFKDHPQAQVVRFKVTPADGGILSQALHALGTQQNFLAQDNGRPDTVKRRKPPMPANGAHFGDRRRRRHAGQLRIGDRRPEVESCLQ